MLKQQATFLNRIVIAIDIIILFVSLWLAFMIRSRWGGVQPFQNYMWIGFFAVVVWPLLLSHYKLYASIRRRSVFDLVTSLINVHLIGGGGLAAIIYLVDPRGFSRGIFLSFLLVSFGLMVFERLALRVTLGYFRSRGYNYRNILIVGAREKALQFHDLLTEHADWGLKTLGFIRINGDPTAAELKGHPILGRVEDLVEVCKSQPVDEVVFCPTKSFVAEAEKYFLDLEELGITVRVVLDFYDLRRSKKELTLFHDQLPILTFHTKSLDSQGLFLKRMLDIVGALVGLAITVLIFPFVALAIKLDAPGPILFGQERVGFGGRTFKCWKFRSMYVDAEQRKGELLGRNEMKGAIFKIKEDPRITRVGRFLRKTSLDELPQFWNVFKGEMSLVGTRPPTPAEVAQYQNWHRRRISIKPGITGLWQVSGRNQIVDFDEIVRLDLHYIDNWSLWFDLKILLRTLFVVFRDKGSC